MIRLAGNYVDLGDAWVHERLLDNERLVRVGAAQEIPAALVRQEALAAHQEAMQ